MYADDTIAAVATPAGPGGIGIVRVSGSLSAAIAARVFAAARPVVSWQSHHLYQGRIVGEGGETLDAGLAVLMRGPSSYTGEDVLELHCHGSPLLLRAVLAQIMRCGARLADPGEFTRRAFLNGRLDLVQAEAVRDLIEARTLAGVKLAARQLGSELSLCLDALREQLVGLKALLEVQIDFSDEEVNVTPQQLLMSVDTCSATIRDLVATFAHGIMLKEGVRVAIVGKPNVGKSSLLNALLGEERAIVTPLPGTTRDTIDAAADFGGLPVVLTDTAGLRECGRADAVERLGMERTSMKMAESQALLVVLDASCPLDNFDRAVMKAAEEIPHVLVLNKIDLPPCMDESAAGVANGAEVVRVSARARTGLSTLRQALVKLVDNGDGHDHRAPALTNLRHRDALQKALHSLDLARASVGAGQPPDLVAVDVQDAIDHIASITGAISNEDVLDKVFSQFCIGK